ncbi:hypothetical protein ROA7023_01487 [Roseisalinus antarcticus]|uniref:Uncharacterized protein n=1 Tax=Roseisalinus antarcticus TaxID=254357 RepID=A0A1Y5SF52_9RHOB|nr:hypothetical protein ROA7023_01487 [Roseisalinus antarcticus]
MFDGFESAPRPAPMADLCPEGTVDRLGEDIVGAVADTAHGRFNAGLAQPFGVADGQELRPAIRVVDGPRPLDRSAIVNSLVIVSPVVV